MDQIKLIQLILIVLIVIFIYYLRKESAVETAYVQSSLNNKEYLVQNLPDKNEAAFMLSVVQSRIFILSNYLRENIESYPNYKPYIIQLCNKVDNIVLTENAPGGRYTSYTIDKGVQIALCLRSKDTKELHDINLVMYVVLHELAHVACPEIDHTELFKQIFIFFLKTAIFLKIYKKINYQLNPHEYCGLVINENLLKK